MHNPFTPCVGGVASADIAVPRHAEELHFYTRLLTTGGSPLWRDDLLSSAGVPVIGLGKASPAYAHLPVQWMPHIQVADVAASARAAVELGGQELMHGRDPEGNSQWAVLADPSGAAFGVVPFVANTTPHPTPPTFGHISQLELVTGDLEASKAFYRSVVGWAYAPETHAIFRADGERVGQFQAKAGIHAKVPSVWLLHLPVDDLDESLARVEPEGGTVVRVESGADGRVETAVVQDLVGACVVLTRVV